MTEEHTDDATDMHHEPLTCQVCGTDEDVSAYVSENYQQADLCPTCAGEAGA